MTLKEQLPPHDIAAEEALLGCLLIDPLAIHKVAGLLQAAHFFRESHRWVYEVMLKLWRADMVIDQITVAHELGLVGRLEAVGGLAFLNFLSTAMPTSQHAEYYAHCVQRPARYRDTLVKLEALARIAYEGQADIEVAEMQMVEALMAGTGLGPAFTLIKDSMTLESPNTGPPFPWRDMATLLQGLRPGKLYIVAGRPSHGKSTLAQSLALNVAHQGQAVVIASLEDSTQGVIDRLLRMHMGMDDLALQRAKAEGNAAIIDALGALGNLPIWTTAEQITADNLIPRLTAFALQRPLGLIIVDYVQLLAESTSRRSRHDQVSDVSIQLARLAQRLGVPILAISQLNRQPDERPDHRPLLADLRETGQLEQDAHAVIFLWRPGNYYPEGTPQWREEYRYRLNVVVAKNKDGATGSFPLWYDLETGRIRDWSPRAG